jgi:prepilin-type N-terminal cleavage/methylation domain-containing protein
MKKNGFTLVEIMITVAVISLLASLGAYAVTKAMDSGRIKKATIELEMISSATLQFAHDTGKWPNGTVRTRAGTTEIWNLSGDQFGLTGSDGSIKNWKGPYYDGEILDPWGNPYFFDPDYRINGENHIVVGSFGPNGKGRNRYDSDDVYVLLDD